MERNKENKENQKKMKTLFLRQSYLDAWEDYQRSLNKPSFIKWDYIVLTASNEEQAQSFRRQIEYRRRLGRLPEGIHYAVLPDPGGRRVGSGGATLNVLDYIAGQEDHTQGNPFGGKRILVIHSGGDSRRIPQYSACGKLFSPVPRELPDGTASTLFDELIITMSGVPARIREGMMTLSGDALLLFNPLQIDFQFRGAAAISIKEDIRIGKDHGVFLNNGKDYVGRFLHKQPETVLRETGAANGQDLVDLDTGAVLLDAELMQALYSLVSTDGRKDDNQFQAFVSEEARISFYGDFLYPLAEESTLEQYLREASEGRPCPELERCRRRIWEALHGFSLKLLCLAPAEFIHFGTTKELLCLLTEEIEDYEFLGWKRLVTTNTKQPHAVAHNALVDENVTISSGAYIEDSRLLSGTEVGSRAIVSNMELPGIQVPENVVLHGLKCKDGCCVVRIYGVDDNPKENWHMEAAFLGTSLFRLLQRCGIDETEVWDGEDRTLWSAKLYPACASMEEAVQGAMTLYRMCRGLAHKDEMQKWKDSRRLSLYSSFNQADAEAAMQWKEGLADEILASRLIHALDSGIYYKDAWNLSGSAGLNQNCCRLLMEKAEKAGFSTRIRIYYCLSQYMKQNHISFDGEDCESLEERCFETIRQTISQSGMGIQATAAGEPGTKPRKTADGDFKTPSGLQIHEEQAVVELPLRVNWGGGWTDTPPYCNLMGGTVLNAAIRLKGKDPVRVAVRRLEQYHIEFESSDIGVSGTAKDIREIQDCRNPYDPFALHKAALIACGIIPLQETNRTLQEILQELGGGIYLSTQVEHVPKGSGLGTSSILAGACAKAILRLLGKQPEEQRLYDIVLSMEQLMSTGGGWQDQVGGLIPGIKFITSAPGLEQKIQVQHVELTETVRKELNDRFALIYTGQRRLARNLLREVVGGYIGSRPETLDALHRMKRTAALMKFELEQGNIDGFAQLMNEHWELSKQLDSGSTNTCIDQIFLVCSDLIDGRFIAGAGGGGFLQVILKKGVTKEQLRKRLNGVFQDSGVDVWECKLV